MDRGIQKGIRSSDRFAVPSARMGAGAEFFNPLPNLTANDDTGEREVGINGLKPSFNIGIGASIGPKELGNHVRVEQETNAHRSTWRSGSG